MQQQPSGNFTPQPQQAGDPYSIPQSPMQAQGGYQQPPQPLGETWHNQLPPQQYAQQPLGYPAPQQPYPQQPYPQQPQGYPAQQAYPPQPYPQMPMQQMNTVVNVNVQHNGPGFLVRAIYFIFVGWWFGLIWLNLGFFLVALVITIPVGLIMLNRLPQVMTLRPSGQQTNVSVSTTAAMSANGMMATQTVNVNITGTQQINFFIRALYFILVGWWVGYIWAYLAYFCCLTILGLPLGVIMFNRLPTVLTLRKN